MKLKISFFRKKAKPKVEAKEDPPTGFSEFFHSAFREGGDKNITSSMRKKEEPIVTEKTPEAEHGFGTSQLQFRY